MNRRNFVTGLLSVPVICLGVSKASSDIPEQITKGIPSEPAAQTKAAPNV